MTEAEVIEIYQYRKSTNSCCNGFENEVFLTGKTAAVASRFKVSPKTIRDIWNRRTWVRETRHLWAENEVPTRRPRKVKEEAPENDSSHLEKPEQKDHSIKSEPLSTETEHTDSRNNQGTDATSRKRRCRGNPKDQNKRSRVPRKPNLEITYRTFAPSQTRTSFLGDILMSISDQGVSKESQSISVPPAESAGSGSLSPEFTAADIDPFHNDWPYW